MTGEVIFLGYNSFLFGTNKRWFWCCGLHYLLDDLWGNKYGISNYKIRWSNFFIIGLLLYLSGSRTAMIVVPATISYFLILRVSPKIRWLVFFVSLIFLISFLYPYVTKAFVVGNTLAQRFQLFDLLISNVDYQMLLNGIGTSSINGKPIHNPLLAGFLNGFAHGYLP